MQKYYGIQNYLYIYFQGDTLDKKTPNRVDMENFKNIIISIPRPIYHQVHALTGYHVESFQWLLFRYGEELKLPHKVFIDAFIYIHIYPHTRQSCIIFQKSPPYISNKILPALKLMAKTFDEIH